MAFGGQHCTGGFSGLRYHYVLLLLFGVFGSELERPEASEGQVQDKSEVQERINETHQIRHRKRKFVKRSSSHLALGRVAPAVRRFLLALGHKVHTRGLATS